MSLQSAEETDTGDDEISCVCGAKEKKLAIDSQ
jgi:hypothetical protein